MGRLLLLLAIVFGAAPARADRPAFPGPAEFAETLAEDPADPEARLGLADHYEARGERELARFHLRLFLSLVHSHPRRTEAAIRLAALRPAQPFAVVEDRRNEGGFLLLRNRIDGVPAVVVPAGPYRRRTSDLEEAPAFVDQAVGDYAIDLWEMPERAHQDFAWEGGYDVPAYYGADGVRWLAEPYGSEPDWVVFVAGGDEELRPLNRLTYFTARAVVRRAGKRIPTDFEWEKAARGGVHLDGAAGRVPNRAPERTFPWGDEPPIEEDGTFRANLHRAAPDRPGEMEERDLPVNSLPERASPYGLLHMAGNVTEWTEPRRLVRGATVTPRFRPASSTPGNRARSARATCACSSRPASGPRRTPRTRRRCRRTLRIRWPSRPCGCPPPPSRRRPAGTRPARIASRAPPFA